MREWTKQAIEEHKMLKPGGRVITALSGGADSVCLLALLSELKGELTETLIFQRQSVRNFLSRVIL